MVVIKKDDMYLYGASGHAKVIIDILKSTNIEIDALIDDNLDIKNFGDYRVLHNEIDLSPIIVSIGSNRIRKHIVSKLKSLFAKALHSSVIISDSVEIGEGTVVMQGAVIQADSILGRHCIINTSSSIDHDCILEDYVHISPNATLCGNVKVGEGSWIGAGATVIQGISIGKWCTIGAGTVIIKDIPDYAVVVGNPARIIKYNNNMIRNKTIEIPQIKGGKCLIIKCLYNTNSLKAA